MIASNPGPAVHIAVLGAVLVSSHLLAEVAQTVDRVVIIDHGRLLAQGALDELTGNGRTLEDVYLELTEGAAG